ncbi:TetR/AcrR family transcriptional regulator [Streptomyces sp. MS06]|uniref:TetR/AcrR family transcriptional regulator n=1 Tax=Streptomyces sp. MS06 TaxID=3385974 RepID=UPI0039A39AC3
MTGSRPSASPPGTGVGTVHRAALEALARHGPRRTGITHIARLARCDRSYLYRHWGDAGTLLREAALREFHRLLLVAREVPGRLPPPRCLPVLLVLRAARLLREHPVVGALARQEPEAVHAAVLDTGTVWHGTAWEWLCAHVTADLPAGARRDAVTLAVLTAALPYALTPPAAADAGRAAEARAVVDRRLGLTLHACLGLPPDCLDCVPAGG